MYERFERKPFSPNHHEIFKPGELIELPNEEKLREFEESLVQILNPDMSGTQTIEWDHRKPISTLIRPSGFNGDMKNIQLAPMDGAFDWLIDANDRGHKFIKGFVLHPKTLDRNFTIEEKRAYLGFHLMGYAVSKSEKHGVERIEADIWYVPHPKSSHAANVSGGIRRYVSAPEHQQAKFDRARLRSIRAVGALAATRGRAAS